MKSTETAHGVVRRIQDTPLLILFTMGRDERNHPKPTVLYVPQYVANFVSKKSCSI